MADKRSETDIAAEVIKYLQGEQWDVYPEVRVDGYGGRRADIVAVQGPLVYIVECKTSLSLAVLAQANYWLYKVHYTGIAVPSVEFGRHRDRDFARLICEQHGMGLMYVHSNGGITESVVPDLHRTASYANRIRESLTEQHRTMGVAGSKSSYYTPFKQTCANLLGYVRLHPGVGLKEAIESIVTHYHKTSTARACMAIWLCEDKVPGVRIEKEGRHITLWPKDSK